MCSLWRMTSFLLSPRYLLERLTESPSNKYIEEIARWREHIKFIFSWKKDLFAALTHEIFFHEKINFICSNQRVISFLLHRYECFENKTKLDENYLQKCMSLFCWRNKGMTSAISSLAGGYEKYVTRIPDVVSYEIYESCILQ